MKRATEGDGPFIATRTTQIKINPLLNGSFLGVNTKIKERKTNALSKPVPAVSLVFFGTKISESLFEVAS